MHQSERLMKARCRLMTKLPWYGHIAMSMIWIPSQMAWLPEQRRTMGVRIVNGGEVQCMYYPPFVDKLTIKELFAVIQHEIEHIVRVHCIRAGSRIHEAWNIACDMTVNGRKSRPRIGYPELSTNEIIIPMKNNIVWIPDDWKEDDTAEAFYNKLEKQQQTIKIKVCVKCGQPKQDGSGGSGKSKKDKGDDEGDGSGKCSECGQSEDGKYRYGGIQGQSIDEHSIWNQSDVSEDEARQVIKDIVDQATGKCQGNVPGHLEQAIKELAKPVVRWRELLRSYLGKHVGNRRKTYSRRNRRHDAFGMPGISHHAASTVTVIVDTSGSITMQNLEQFFAEIDAISSQAKVHILQWDYSYQGYTEYRRNDWKKFKIHGRGGTDMAQPMQWLIDNSLVSDVVVMLTDGICNYIDAKKVEFPTITVITEPETKGPGYGHEIRMKA